LTKPTDSAEEQRPPVKKVISAAQKEMEVFNPQSQAGAQNAASVAKGKDAEAKPLTVEQYHENLFSSTSNSEMLKVSPEASESTDKKSSAKKSNLIKELKAEEVYEALQMSIPQAELKGQIKQVIDMKQRQNIERDLFRADGYVNELLEYLLQFEIPQGDDEADQIARIKLAEQEARSGGVNYLTLFLTSLTQPQQRDLLEELRKLQT